MVEGIPSNAAAAGSGPAGGARDPRKLREVRIYDTLQEKVVPLNPLVPPRVGMFVCGLTPYKPSHIGHARTFVFFDVVARFLRHLGYRVFYLQNSTDIDDKIIRISNEEKVDFFEVSERNFQLYLLNMEALGVRSVNLYARTTDYIPEIVTQIRQLTDKGFGYTVEGGDVFFEIAKFPRFGALSKQKVESVQPGARVEVDARKRSPEDFALWKSAKPQEPWWESPWGRGRPGWHIEDTAITVNVLGPRYDLHGGGSELRFPHHEAEIAQAESATGLSPLAALWMHAGLLNMRGEKMSKSLGNVEPLDETLRKWNPAVLRYFLLSGLYRSPLEYAGTESLQEAERSFETLAAPFRRLNELWSDLARANDQGSRGPELPKEVMTRSRATEERIIGALAEDFQLREATSQLFGWGKEVNALLTKSEGYSTDALDVLLAPYELADQVLGFFSIDEAPGRGALVAPSDISSLVELVLAARQRARARGDFA
ncbi:MAG: cysteine--tRNA ligase, partial [Euryarchaeota archaeon]|nr:cysteine--tRNA ligase [Euryarchaeota archaeon]